MNRIKYLCILSALLSISLLAADDELKAHEKALQRLMEGNGRYVRDLLKNSSSEKARLQEKIATHAPFAVVVACSDARVSPDIIFDQGIGDLFIVRVAGNVIGPLELDSIDYAAIYLGATAIVVVGHESCGAVTAVVQNTTKDIESLAKLIRPAVQEAKKIATEDNLVEVAIKTNAGRMRDFLLTRPPLSRLVKDEKLQVHAAYYNLHTGAVELLDTSAKKS
jgi:carbonic anhydrase